MHSIKTKFMKISKFCEKIFVLKLSLVSNFFLFMEIFFYLLPSIICFYFGFIYTFCFKNLSSITKNQICCPRPFSVLHKMNNF